MSIKTKRQFLIDHLSEFRYQEFARGSLMLLHLLPKEECGQRVLKFDLDIDPLATPIQFEDAFGNPCHLFNIYQEHRQMILHVRAQVETVAPPSVASSLDNSAWEAMDVAESARYWEFLTPSHFARPSAVLEAFMTANRIRRGNNPLSSLLETASTLHKTFRYEPGSTQADSPIEDILETGRGVCQDYTHVMIAIARSWGIPSRYVSGYLHLEGVEERSPAAASHAWAEFLLPDLGWIGIDPINDTLADHRHIRIATGRDYADVSPTRGVVFGGGQTSLKVRVDVVESHEPVSPTKPRAEQSNLRNFASTPSVLRRPSSDQ